MDISYLTLPDYVKIEFVDTIEAAINAIQSLKRSAIIGIDAEWFVCTLIGYIYSNIHDKTLQYISNWSSLIEY